MSTSFVVENVQSIIGENASQIGTGPHTLDTPFEIRLRFPECSVTKSMGHKDIRTLVKLRLLNTTPVMDFIKTKYKSFDVEEEPTKETSEKELCFSILSILNECNIVMNMTVEYHHFGNLKATSVDAVCLSHPSL